MNRKTLKELNKENKYTLKQLEKLKRFRGVYLDTYFHNYDYWNEKTNKYETVVEIRGKSKIEKENFETVDAIIRTLRNMRGN